MTGDRGQGFDRAPVTYHLLPVTYQGALAYLAGFVDLERGGVGATMGLERIQALLGALGQPQERYPSILIAGTKGKGSTAAMVERALRAAGYHTGLYTQPHLHTIRERVQIDGAPINESAFAHHMEAVRAAEGQVCNTTQPTTAYEAVTALAFEAFAAASVDAAVVEVGLGGRLDATNVLNASVSAITSISLDHTQVLGNTVEAIAAEKANIIKPDRPCVSAPQPPGAMAVIGRIAESRRAPLWVAGVNGARWDAPPRDRDLLLARGPLAGLHPSLRGRFQRVNVAVAATILDALDANGILQVPMAATRVGIEEVVWPGRFEVVATAPTIVLDGAHNVESARRLREALAEEFPGRSLVLVLGVAADKDVAGIVRALLDGARALVIATHANHPRAADPGMIHGMALGHGSGAIVAPTVATALAEARSRAGPDVVIVATGSLHVVAEAREALGLAPHYDEPAYDPWAAR